MLSKSNLRFVYILTTLLWWATLGGLIVLTLLLLALRLMFNFVFEDAARLESLLNRGDFGQVTVGSSQVSWDGMVPRIQATDLAIEGVGLNASLGEIIIKPQIIPSLLNMRPLFNPSEIRNARLDFDLQSDKDKAGTDIGKLVSILLLFSGGGNFRISKSQIVLHTAELAIPIAVDSLDNIHNDTNWWIQASIGISDLVPNLQFLLVNEGSHPKTFDDLDLRIHMRSNALVLPGRILGIEDAHSRLNLSVDNLESWVHIHNLGFGVFHTKVDNLRFEQNPPNGLNTAITFWPKAGTKGLNSRDWQGWLSGIYHGQQPLIQNLYIGNGVLLKGKDAKPLEQVFVSADSIYATRISQVLEPFGRLFEAVSMQGELHNLRALVPLEHAQDSYARARMYKGGLRLHKPQVHLQRINANLEIHQGQIHTRLDTPLTLGLGDYFAEPWNINRVLGDLHIDVRDPNYFAMNLNRAAISFDELRAEVTLGLHIPYQPGTTAHASDLLNLAARFAPTPMEYKDRFIPYKLLGQQREERLRQIIRDGTVSGDLRLKVGRNISDMDYLLQLKVADSTLQYLPERPQVEHLTGNVSLTRELLTASGNGTLHNIQVTLNKLALHFKSKRLKLDIHSTAEVQALIELASVLLEKPDMAMLPGLAVSNPLELDASLDIPLDKPGELDYSVNLGITDNHIEFTQIPDYPLVIQQGGFNLTNGVVRQTVPLQASWHNEQVVLTTSSTDIMQGQSVQLDAHFGLSSELLNLAIGANRQILDGRGDMQLSVVFNPKSFRLLQAKLQGDLTQLDIGLPDSWYKPAGMAFQATGSYLAHSTQGGEINFEIPAYVKGRLVVDKASNPLQGWIGLGFASLEEPPEKQGLNILASFTTIDIRQWLDWWNKLAVVRSSPVQPDGETHPAIASRPIDQSNGRTSANNGQAAANLVAHADQSTTKTGSPTKGSAIENSTTGQAGPGASGDAATGAGPDAQQLRYTLPKLLTQLQLRLVANDIHYNDLSITSIDSQLNHTQNSWIFSLTSDQAEGFIQLPFDQQQVTKVVFNKLLIPEIGKQAQKEQQAPEVPSTQPAEQPAEQPPGEPREPSPGAPPDPLANVDMTKTGKVDFLIYRVAYGPNELGKWTWQLRPTHNAAKLQNIRASYKNASLRGSADWSRQQDKSTRTSIDLTLVGNNIHNMAGLVQAKKGQVAAFLSWPGSPAAFYLPHVYGNIGMDFSDGRMHTNTPALSLLNFLGLLNIETIGRRLTFDFSDQGSSLSFNRAKGEFSLSNSVITNITPFAFDGTTISFTINGTTNLISGALDQDIIVRVSVGEALPLGALLLGTTPQTALLLWISNWLFDSPISAITSAKYHVGGTLKEPQLKTIQLLGAGLPGAKAKSIDNKSE